MGYALILVFVLALLSGCASSSSHDVSTHCMEHTVGQLPGGTTTVSDCDISSKTKDMGW